MNMTHRNPLDALREKRIGTAAQWHALGLTQMQLRTLVQTGELVRVRHGVYAVKALVARAESKAKPGPEAEAEPDPTYGHALQAAAAIVAVGRGIPSHHTAALIHGLALREPPAEGVVTLTRRPGKSSPRPGATSKLIFHTAGLTRAQLTNVHGVPVTSVARTVVDLARTLSFMDGVVVADSALHLGTATAEDMRDVLETCKRWTGVRQAGRVIDFADGLSESVLESCARVAFHEYGLPAPELQVRMYQEGESRPFARVDFYWPEYRTVAEADGEIKYAKDGQQRALRQLERDKELRKIGRKVLHFGWRDVFPYPIILIRDLQATFEALLTPPYARNGYRKPGHTGQMGNHFVRKVAPSNHLVRKVAEVLGNEDRQRAGEARLFCEQGDQSAVRGESGDWDRGGGRRG
jgi:predicted transcriptional regulator of viral defense system